MSGKPNAAKHETPHAPARAPLVRRRSRQDPERWLRDTMPEIVLGADALRGGVVADGAAVLPGDAELDVAEAEVTAVDSVSLSAKPR